MKDIRFNGNLPYTVKDLGFVEVQRKKDFIFSYKNGKNYHSLIYVKNGELEYSFFRQKTLLRVTKGQLLFVPKNLPYTTTYLQDNTHIVILTFNVEEHDGLPFSLPLVKHLPTAELIFGAFSGENTRNSLFLAAKIYELLFWLEQESSSVPKKYAQLTPAINELQKQYFKNEKIAYYAKLCDMSESNFRKLFKEYTGKSPIEYRNIIRVSVAKNFLDSGEFTATEAAYLVGFNNMSFFYELYQKFK